NLGVVLDTGPSMAVWGPTLAGLRAVFARFPGFRRVRVWHLDTAGPDPVVRPAPRHPGSPPVPPRRPDALLDPSGNNLVLVVTDAVSPAWHGPGVAALLAGWSRGGVAVVQVLPPRLWPRTALGGCPGGEFRPG